MTVTITGSVKDVTGVADNETPWRFASVIRFADDGSVITDKPRDVRAVGGRLKVELEPGFTVVTYGQRVWQVTVPETPTTLKALIEAAVAFPPDTAQTQLNEAVAKAAPGFVAAELEAQTAAKVTADLEARAPQVIPGDTPGTVRNKLGDAVGPEFPAVVGLWDGIADRDEGVKKATGGIVPIERFNPDSVGWKAALEAAVAEASASGGKVLLGAGKTYSAVAGAVLTDLHVRIDFNGARVVRAAAGATDFSAISIVYTTSTPQSVVAVTAQTYDWGVGSSDTTPVSRIELSSTAGWAVGDYAVIVGDDAIPGANPSRANQYEGERFRIAGISGNYLYAARPLRVSLATNIRIARMTQRDVVLIDPWVEDESGSPAGRNDPAIVVQSAVKPRLLGGRMRNLQGEGVQFQGCVEGVCGGVFEVANLRTSDFYSAYGYGIRLVSCCDFDVRGLRGSFTRHLITTGAGQAMSADSPDLHRYGSNFGHRFQGTGGETGHASFDFHEDAAYSDIDGAQVAFSHREPLGTKAAFQLRGRNTGLLNSSSKGGAGVSLIGFTGGADFRIANYQHTILPGMSATDTYGIQCDCSNMASRGKLSLSEVQLFGPGMVGNMVRLTKTAVRASRLDIVAHNDASYSPFTVINVLADSELVVDELYMDLRGISGTVRPYLLADSLSAVRVNRLVVLTGGAAWTLGSFNNADGTVNIGRLETDTMPSDFTGVGAGATWSIGDIVVNQQSILTGTDSQSNISSTLNMFHKSTRILDVALTAARTITEPTKELFTGRERTYVRTAAATGAFAWNIGSDSLASPGMWLRRRWTGTAWITTGKGYLTAAPSGSAALNFPSVAAQSVQDLTITVTGAVLGDSVALGVPTAAVTAGIAFTAWVSAADTVTVRAHNYTAGALDPASGTFKATIVR